MPVDKFGRMSDTKTKDTGVSLTYINNNYIRSDGTTPVSGSIDMRGNTLYNVSDPVNPWDVANKEYVDNTKGSGIIGGKIKHLIAVHAGYCGPLKKGEYPFKFSGGNFKTCEVRIEKYIDFKGSTTGFLMPHSGRIKKIIFEGLNFLDTNEFFKKLTEGLDGEELEKVKKNFEEFKRKAEKMTTDFFTANKEEKFLFKIVKFEKNLNEEDYPQPYHNTPKIISSILTDKFKGRGVRFVNDVFNFGIIFRAINQDDGTLSEGDVINIEAIRDQFTHEELVFSNIPLEQKIFEAFVKNFSYNTTFLIELDPL